jgi:hypothetical protein
MVLNSEYPFLRWLERNGYDVVYWSGVDTHRQGHLLSGRPPPEGDGVHVFPENGAMRSARWPASGGDASVPAAGRRLQAAARGLGHGSALPAGGAVGCKQRDEAAGSAEACGASADGGATTTVQVGDDGRKPRLFLSVGHDEYWSGRQRLLVEAARDNGVSLGFFSGNEVYWRIRYEPSLADGVSHRTVVVYKDSQSMVKLDPHPAEWTGTFRDGRLINPLGAWPENALTGTLFTVNAWRHDALEVPAAKYGGHRFWRHTKVAAATADDTYTSIPGILGHEWDEDIDNGARPPGLQRLSETTLDNLYMLQDEGATFDSGSATHHLTLYRHPSGALVFGGGTCQWGWGLDGHHDSAQGVPPERANPNNIRVGTDQQAPDATIQQATVNLFADMRVFPATLQSGLIASEPSADVEPPSCRLANAAPLSDGHLLISGEASDDGGGVVAAVEVRAADAAGWHPARPGRRGFAEWTFAVAAGGTGGVLCRAIDDSGNIGPETMLPH